MKRMCWGFTDQQAPRRGLSFGHSSRVLKRNLTRSRPTVPTKGGVTVRVCKLSNGKICQLLQHDVPVKFDSTPGWSLVARPIEAPTTQQAVWWVQSTQIAWILTV